MKTNGFDYSVLKDSLQRSHKRCSVSSSHLACLQTTCRVLNDYIKVLGLEHALTVLENMLLRMWGLTSEKIWSQ